MNDFTLRPKKGKSILAFPSDYTVVDIETTGLSSVGAEIIEVSALRYRGDEPCDAYTALIKPSYPIPYFITQLTGITNDMVEDAAPREEVLTSFADFVGGDIVIGHNVHFDVNFLYDEIGRYLGRDFSNDFVDVLRLSRKYLPFLPSHKQVAIAEYFSLDTSGAHRALKDTEICAENYIRIKKLALGQK